MICHCFHICPSSFYHTLLPLRWIRLRFTTLYTSVVIRGIPPKSCVPHCQFSPLPAYHLQPPIVFLQTGYNPISSTAKSQELQGKYSRRQKIIAPTAREEGHSKTKNSNTSHHTGILRCSQGSICACEISFWLRCAAAGALNNYTLFGCHFCEKTMNFLDWRREVYFLILPAR